MGPATLRIVETHASAYRRVWMGSVITSFATPILFLLAMGLGMGTLVDEGGGLEGVSYLSFLAPGLLAATGMQVAATESAWRVHGAIKWQKTYLAALATPVGTADLASGHLIWLGVRVFLSAVVFAVVMTLFGAATLGGALLATIPTVLTGLAFAGPITAFSASLENDYYLAGLFRFGIVPMFLFSGTFFPVTQLPAWSLPIAFATPLWHGVQLARAAALGIDPYFPPGAHVAYLLVWVIGGWMLAVWRFRVRLVT
jgi:lipooligosaccharide transport system permease protein